MSTPTKRKRKPGAGGARPGAGPKFRQMTLKLGDKILVRRLNTEGELWTIIDVSKTTLTLHDEHGEQITIRR